ncbi:neurogenic locus Notch protein-like [Mytilus edulis]|uniref:neurogenic locus Notch protein-like n=1 Tax=Mytilus edulis TaxID=6550 RepID=UPI0039EF6086
MFIDLNAKYIFTLVILRCVFSNAEGPLCLECDRVAKPSDCRNVKRCGDQELCSIRKYIDTDSHEWFEVGCSSTQKCFPITSVIGKRLDSYTTPIKYGLTTMSTKPPRSLRSTGETIVCEKCCTGDICNAGSLCHTVGFQHEMVCFNCSWASTADGCHTIELCAQDEMCFIQKLNAVDYGYNAWKTGCQHKEVCQKMQLSQGNTCQESCCSSDLCNSQCISNGNGSKCVDKSPTCRNSAFQAFACPDKELQKSCMKSCGLCHCDPNPCAHGTCKSSLQGYSCSCHHDYTGSICDKKIPERHIWKWSDCSIDRTGIVIDNFDVYPKPIKIPGNISVTLNSSISRRLPADSHYRLNVTIDKKLLNHWHAVPCSKRVGTCVYDDVCEMMTEYFKNHTCPKIVTDHGLTCSCPVNGISYFINSFTTQLNSIPSSWYFLAAGDFRVRVELLHGGYMIGCLNVEWTITVPCHGFLCG